MRRLSTTVCCVLSTQQPRATYHCCCYRDLPCNFPLGQCICTGEQPFAKDNRRQANRRLAQDCTHSETLISTSLKAEYTRQLMTRAMLLLQLMTVQCQWCYGSCFSSTCFFSTCTVPL